jgi:two-component system sensor histidine kinase KdpD
MPAPGAASPTLVTAPPRWPALLVWALAWAAMLALDGRLDVANLAMLLVLGAALAAPWLSPLGAVVASIAAVLAFNLVFVPPRWTLSVDLQQHALLLVTMGGVSVLVSASMARQRRLALAERLLAARAGELRLFGEALHDAEDPRACLSRLRMLLTLPGAAPATVWVADDGMSDDADMPGAKTAPARLGDADPDPDEADGLRHVLHDGRALGPGTGRWEGLSAWGLPMRGHGRTMGAAWVRLAPGPYPSPSQREHLQALCDRMGTELERAVAHAAAAREREVAALQALRGTLLSAIAHDHRTPLATIIGAASSLHDQDDRLDPARRRRLAATIVDEATQLARVVDDTLQLARLDAPDLALRRDWESAEELVGSVVGRVRRRDPAHRLQTDVEPGLPLVRCDAVLVVQLLENLVANALRHAGDADGPVEVGARRDGERLLLEVRDRGPGLPPGGADGARRAPEQGTGLGLAVCRAIARVHGGEITLDPREGGGTVAACALPLEAAPAMAPEAER